MSLELFPYPIKPKTSFFAFLVSLWPILCFSQITNGSGSIIQSFQDYTELPREVAYAHLNKSVYIKGETLAFNVYIFDKGKKGLSQLTTNVYCSISDDRGKTIKSHLLLADSGIAHGSFFVDSLFTSGNYTFKAYTNWMKNFEEQNFYIQDIKVIDPETESQIVPKIIASTLDAQFLPEGGHLLANTENSIGVVIKDSLGFGVPFVEGRLLNSKNETINQFKCSAYGIGKFRFTPRDGETYRVHIDFEGTQQFFDLPLAETHGLALELFDLYQRGVLRLSTNGATLNSIKQKPYTLAIHNGFECKTVEVVFTDSLELLLPINYANLTPGINVFTVFNENNVPVLERLFFNQLGIERIESSEVNYTIELDSTLITIPFKAIGPGHGNRFSISVLPEGTTSYNPHHNIISYTYLQPYVKGFIENAQYYFTEVSRKKQYELDNLLLTQGWSSYDWNAIFNNPPKPNYNFETGIAFKANVNTAKTGRFLLFPSAGSPFEIFEVDVGKNTFEKNGLFPFEDDTIKLSEVQKSNSVKKSGVYMQFFPSKIPDIDKYTKVLPLKERAFFKTNATDHLLETSWNEYEQLDEVIISVNKEKERMEKLKNSTVGQVDVFDERMRNGYVDFASYIQTKGFRVVQSNGELSIASTMPATPPPTIYIDDRLLFDFDELYFYRLDHVDYIIVDKSGFGEGMRGAGGVIKIYTDPMIAGNSPTQLVYQDIEIPLTFAKPAKFYAPKYNSYSSDFYKEYGVIAWYPNMSTDEHGRITFKISNRQATSIKIFIEGTTNNGSLISEVKTVNFN